MMKKLFSVVLVVLLSVPAFSQLKFGIKAGLSTTSLSMETLKTVTSGTTSYTIEALKGANYGFHAGAFMRLTFLGIHVQPELLFSSTSNEYTVKDLAAPAVSIPRKQTFNKLDIPVMVGFKLGPVRLNAGPAASLLINSPTALITGTIFENVYNRMTFGYQAGLGIDIIKKLTVDVRYEGSLKKYQNQINALSGGAKFPLDDRQNAFLLSVGLIF
jgi:opacity protein-like surface antigen